VVRVRFRRILPVPARSGGGRLKNHRVSDDIYDRVCARWGDKGVVDLAGLIGYYSFVSVTLNVLEVPTPPGAKLLSETVEP
jgi:hypothetical protein